MRRALGRFCTATSVAALAALLLPACGSGAGHPVVDTATSSLRIGIGQVGRLSSPGQGLRQLVQNLTVENLASLTDEGRPRPWLAKDWSVSPDGLALTVNLPPNLTFHDGSPLTAMVVANALQAMLPNTHGRRRLKMSRGSRRRAISRSSSGFAGRRRSCSDALETPIPKPGASQVGTGPLRGRRSEGPDGTDGQRSLRARPARHRSDRAADIPERAGRLGGAAPRPTGHAV